MKFGIDLKSLKEEDQGTNKRILKSVHFLRLTKMLLWYPPALNQREKERRR